MKRFLKSVLLLWVAQTLIFASASPAQDLFDEAVFFLSLQYGGFAEQSPQELAKTYQEKLNEACQSQEDCATEEAVIVIKELLETLGDEHTNYYEPVAYEGLQLLFGGGSQQRFGLVTTPLESKVGLIVLEVFPDSPAEAAGLKRGDQLLAVNGMYFPVHLSERQALLFEAENSSNVTRLQIKRPNKERFELELQASNISLERLPSLEMLDEVAYLRIPNFVHFEKVARKTHELIATLETDKLIIDLRNNPGGALTECLAAAGAFIGDNYRILEGRILNQTYLYENGSIYNQNAEGTRFELFTLEPASYTGEIIILINEGTASCAEYFSFDLQDHATIIGESSGGVGNTATGFVKLSNGAGLQITSAKATYLDGSSDPDAVSPDIEVKDDLIALSQGTDIILEKALELLRQP